jgi:hypothetical protein
MNPTEETPVSDPTPTAPVVAPKLPLPLPAYHGQEPAEMKSTFSGLKDQLRKAHERGERLVSVIEWKVSETGHRETADGVLYVEALTAAEFYEVEGDAGRRLLAHVRQHGRDADDGAAGRAPLVNDGEDAAAHGVVTENGTVATGEEIAELRGDPVAALEDASRTPVVVVYSDGERFLWPEEYPEGTARPVAGEESDADGGVVYVEKLLHHETGETIAEHTPGQRDEVLEAKEQAAAVAEAEDTGGAAEPDDGAGPFPDAPLEPDVAAELAAGLASASSQAAGESDEIPFLPGPEHFAFVDRKGEEIFAELDGISGDAGRDFLLRATKAEEQGRGRGLKPRAGVLEKLEKRAGVIFLEGEPKTDPPADAGSFEPPDGELEVDADDIGEEV